MQTENDFEAVIQEIMLGWDVPGLAVGIVDGGEILYAGGFGVQSLETRALVTLDTVFCIQSVSKCFVATAVMQLAERGKLDLDAPVVQTLPYFELDDDRFRQITLRQVLSHTAGMPDIDESDYVEWVAHPEHDAGAAERFVRSLKGRTLVANPGERFNYSNLAYNVLGDLLAKVTGTTFEGWMQQQILIPAGMPNSTFLPAEVPAHRLAWPHLRSPEMRVNPSYPYHRADAPSSSLHTTILDLCRWAITSLERGGPPGPGLLSPVGYDRMWTPVAKRGNPPGIYEEMGLGWTLGHFRGVRTVSHGGAGFGGTAFLLLLPEKNCAAAVLCNEESNACYRAVQAAAEAVLGHKPQANRVSWIVPVSRAMAQGGIAAAYTRCAELKRSGDREYSLIPEDLDSLALQLLTANRSDLAVEVLGLSIHEFPGRIEPVLERARLYLRLGEIDKAQTCISSALQIEPANPAALRLLERIG